MTATVIMAAMVASWTRRSNMCRTMTVLTLKSPTPMRPRFSRSYQLGTSKYLLATHWLFQDDRCRFKRVNVGGTDSGHMDIQSGNETALMEAVATQVTRFKEIFQRVITSSSTIFKGPHLGSHRRQPPFVPALQERLE